MAKVTQAVTPYAAGTLAHVALENIRQHPDLPLARPIDKAHVAELTASIMRSGLDQPLLVWNGGGDGVVVELGTSGKEAPASFLIAGAHRKEALKAFRKAKPSEFASMFPEGIPVHIMGGELEDAIAAQLRENLARKDVTPQEVLPLIQRLQKDFNLKQKDIARRIGKTEGYVSMVLDIESELGEEGADAVKSGEVSLRGAVAAASEVKKAKKAGKAPDVKGAIAKAKAKKAKSKAGVKRVSAKTLYERFQSMPNVTIGKKVLILAGALAYLAGEEDEIPDELSGEAAE